MAEKREELAFPLVAASSVTPLRWVCRQSPDRHDSIPACVSRDRHLRIAAPAESTFDRE
jgi:hypothetical protein